MLTVDVAEWMNKNHPVKNRTQRISSFVGLSGQYLIVCGSYRKNQQWHDYQQKGFVLLKTTGELGYLGSDYFPSQYPGNSYLNAFSFNLLRNCLCWGYVDIDPITVSLSNPVDKNRTVPVGHVAFATNGSSTVLNAYAAHKSSSAMVCCLRGSQVARDFMECDPKTVVVYDGLTGSMKKFDSFPHDANYYAIDLAGATFAVADSEKITIMDIE